MKESASSVESVNAAAKGEELYREIKDVGVLDKAVMVFGQMNEQPGARFRVGHAALTMAEYFRDDAKARCTVADRQYLSFCSSRI